MGTQLKGNHWIRKSRATNLSKIILSVNAAKHILTQSNYEDKVQIRDIFLHNYEIPQTEIMTKASYKSL